MKQLQIFILLLVLFIGSCNFPLKKTETCTVPKEQYLNDKKQIADYILKNVEFYRLNPEANSISCYPDYANDFFPYSRMTEIASDTRVTSPIPASQYLSVFVDTIVYNQHGTKCFIFCAVETKVIKSKRYRMRRKNRNIDAKAYVGVRDTISDSLMIYPFKKYQVLFNGDRKACKYVEFYYFHWLKGDYLSGSHYEGFGAFKQNVDDPDFFEKSIIFQRYDDSTFNYQYHYMDLMKYPFLR